MSPIQYARPWAAHVAVVDLGTEDFTAQLARRLRCGNRNRCGHRGSGKSDPEKKSAVLAVIGNGGFAGRIQTSGRHAPPLQRNLRERAPRGTSSIHFFDLVLNRATPCVDRS